MFTTTTVGNIHVLLCSEPEKERELFLKFHPGSRSCRSVVTFAIYKLGSPLE